MSAPTSIAIAPDILAFDWQIVESGHGWELQYRDPVKRRWHEMYTALTVAECRMAYWVFREGETPDGNDVWP